jgi:hypothetical protein
MADEKCPLVGVHARHLTDTVSCAAFLPDHTLLFSTEGDLWHGLVQIEANEDHTETYGVLEGYRYAPVASRYTYDGTPFQEGVADIAISRRMAYLHVSRMNGSGWGSIARVALPPLSQDDTFTIRNSVKDAIRALRSYRELDDCPGAAYLCSSRDRKRVLFQNDTGGRFIYQNDNEADYIRRPAGHDEGHDGDTEGERSANGDR